MDLDAGATAVSDAFLYRVADVGTPAEVREQLLRVWDFGVDLPVVRVPVGTGDPWVACTLCTFAPGDV